MKNFKSLILVALVATGCAAGKTYVGSNQDRAAIEKTSKAIRVAFAHSDVATIMTYYHPNVVLKALSYDSYVNGHDSVQAYLTGAFKVFNLEFIDNQVESLSIEGKTAVEQSQFTIKGTPKNGGDPFLCKVRAMTVYVPYKNSPTGWASIREVALPVKQ